MLARLARLFRTPAAAPIWVEAAELDRWLAGEGAPVVVDVRGPDEFDGPLGHIDGARNIPVPELPRHMRDLMAEGRPLVMVCLTDKRSAQAAAELLAAGVRDVAVLRGGMKGWRATIGYRPTATADRARSRFSGENRVPHLSFSSHCNS
jgi:rhodanese-related sulfurtransferase